MHKILSMILVACAISGCTSQRLFSGAIYIVNSCGKNIIITTSHYTPWMGSIGGGKVTQFELPTHRRKAIAIFRLSRTDQDTAYLFFNDGDDFQIKISDGKKEKVFHGQQVYRLSENVTNVRDRKHDYVNYEIRSKEICP